MARKASTLDVKVNADTRGLEKGYKRAGAETKKFTGQTNKLGDSIKGKLGAAMAGVAIGAFAVKMARAAQETIRMASAYDEAANKAKTVFGTAGTSMVNGWAENTVTAMGLSSGAALEAAGSFGNLLTAFGATEGKAAEMSKNLTSLAADLASFNNTSIEDAIAALRSGLSGEMEPLKRYGATLSDVRLRAEALAMGLEVTTGTLDPLTKSMAAYSLIMKDTKTAQGDFIRTSDGLANTQRILGAAVDDAKEEIGRGLVEALETATESMGGPEGMAEVIGDLGYDIAAFTGGVGKLIDKLNELRGVTEDTDEATENQGNTLSKFLQLIPVVGTYLGVFSNQQTEAKRADDARTESIELWDLASRRAAAAQRLVAANTLATVNPLYAQAEAARTAAGALLALSRKDVQMQDAAGRAKWRKFDEDLAKRRKAQQDAIDAASAPTGGGSSGASQQNEKAIDRYDRKLDAYSKKWKRQTDIRVQALNDEVAAWERVADTVTGAFNTSLGAAIDDYTDKLASVADLDQQIADAIAAGDEKGAAKAAAEKAALGHVEDYVTAWLAQLEYNTAVKNKIAAAMATFVANNPGLAKGAEALTAELLSLDPATADAAITKMVNEGTLAKIAGTLQTEAAKDNVVSVAMADMFYAAGITAAEENLRAITEEMESDKAKKKLEKIGKKAGKTLGDALANEIRQAVNQAVASANAARAAAGRRIASAPATAGANTRSASAGPVNIHVHAAVADPVAVGRTVENVLNKRASRLGL